MLKFTPFFNFKRALEKWALIKIANHAFEAADFKAHFLIKICLIKKNVYRWKKNFELPAFNFLCWEFAICKVSAKIFSTF